MDNKFETYVNERRRVAVKDIKGNEVLPLPLLEGNLQYTTDKGLLFVGNL